MILGLAALVLALAWTQPGQLPDPEAQTPQDPIVRLEERLARGEVEMAYDSARGWLPSLLAALELSPASQVLVFSRTSLQTDRVSPWTPRALYFGDDVYVGWIPDSPIIEIASVDPNEAAAFYTLAQRGEGPPTFQRESTTCLMCHESRAVTGGPPGFIVRSVLTDRLGYPVTPLHEGSTSDRTAFERRFGGFYVTGSHGRPGHAGNVHAPQLSHEITDRRRAVDELDLQAGGGVLELGERFDPTPYLTPHSDLVALLVLTHQAHVHNLVAAARAAGLEAEALRGPDGTVPAFARQRVESAIERLLRAMLFADEAPLPGPIRGTSGFADVFAAAGPFDERGRTLRSLDLDTRLFRYRLSFLIYSDAFRGLPEGVREGFYARLHAILSGTDSGEEWAHLGSEERRALAEILADTDPGYSASIR